jgi:hypothetical protein
MIILEDRYEWIHTCYSGLTSHEDSHKSSYHQSTSWTMTRLQAKFHVVRNSCFILRCLSDAKPAYCHIVADWSFAYHFLPMLFSTVVRYFTACVTFDGLAHFWYWHDIRLLNRISMGIDFKNVLVLPLKTPRSPSSPDLLKILDMLDLCLLSIYWWFWLVISIHECLFSFIELLTTRTNILKNVLPLTR